MILNIKTCKFLINYPKHIKVRLFIEYRITRIVAGAIINFEGNFARKYFVIFWRIKVYFVNSLKNVVSMQR